jgi:hypothetical protein
MHAELKGRGNAQNNDGTAQQTARLHEDRAGDTSPSGKKNLARGVLTRASRVRGSTVVSG